MNLILSRDGTLLPLRIRVDLVGKSMKGYFTLPRTLEIESYHQMQFNVIITTLFLARGFTLQQEIQNLVSLTDRVSLNDHPTYNRNFFFKHIDVDVIRQLVTNNLI